MPICPGCERAVSYAELPVHTRSCKGIWSEAPARETQRVDRLAVLVRRLERRVARLDARSDEYEHQPGGGDGQPGGRSLDRVGRDERSG